MSTGKDDFKVEDDPETAAVFEGFASREFEKLKECLKKKAEEEKKALVKDDQS